MKTDFIPFQLGEEYDNFEFYLNEFEDLIICDKYKYIGVDFLSILGQTIKCVYLYFNSDILVRVDVILKAKKEQKFIEISDILNDKMKKEGRLKILQKKILQKEWRGKKSLLAFQFNLDENSLCIILTKNEYSNI